MTANNQTHRVMKTLRFINKYYKIHHVLNFEDIQLPILPPDQWIAGHLKSSWKNDAAFKKSVKDILRPMGIMAGSAMLIPSAAIAAMTTAAVTWPIALGIGTGLTAFAAYGAVKTRPAVNTFKNDILPDFARNTLAAYGRYKRSELFGFLNPKPGTHQNTMTAETPAPPAKGRLSRFFAAFSASENTENPVARTPADKPVAPAPQKPKR